MIFTRQLILACILPLVFCLGLSSIGCSTKLNFLKRSPSAHLSSQIIRRDRYIHNVHGFWLGHVLGGSALNRWKEDSSAGKYKIVLETPWQATERFHEMHIAIGTWADQEKLDLSKTPVVGELVGALNPGIPLQVVRVLGNEQPADRLLGVVFSLAKATPPGLFGSDQILWLLRESRELVPPNGEVDRIVDLVVREYKSVCHNLNNEACSDWSKIRDRIKLNSQFKEASSASQMLGAVTFALLFGEGELLRTLEIASRSSLSPHEGVAAAPALLGLINGEDWILAHFGERRVSDYVDIPGDSGVDQIPADPKSDDSLLLLSIRMMSTVEKFVLLGGGQVVGAEFITPDIRSRR